MAETMANEPLPAFVFCSPHSLMPLKSVMKTAFYKELNVKEPRHW